MGKQIYGATFDTALGPVTITASDEGLLALDLPLHSASSIQRPSPPNQFTNLIARLKSYFNGAKVNFNDTKLDLSSATPFQKKVWGITRRIPYGETMSYRWVAEQIGKPSATRAVGQALARNPLPIIIPCHRIVASDGSLGGYSGGLEMKRTLLRLEKCPFPQPKYRPSPLRGED